MGLGGYKSAFLMLSHGSGCVISCDVSLLTGISWGLLRQIAEKEIDEACW